MIDYLDNAVLAWSAKPFDSMLFQEISMLLIYQVSEAFLFHLSSFEFFSSGSNLGQTVLKINKCLGQYKTIRRGVYFNLSSYHLGLFIPGAFLRCSPLQIEHTFL